MCSFSFFKNWIASNFKEGMNFENRNLWHLEHVFPVGACASDEDILKSFFYRNIKPEWSSENIAKRDRINESGLVSAIICGIKRIKIKRPDQISAEIWASAGKLGFDIVYAH